MSEWHLPTPAQVAAAMLAKLPGPVQRFVQNLVAILQWIGLPMAILSFLSDRAWIIDAGRWIVTNAGVLRPWLDLIGHACTLTIDAWHGLTRPIRLFLENVLPFHVSAWMVDLLTALMLLALGRLRAAVRLRLAELKYADLLLSHLKRTNNPFYRKYRRKLKRKLVQDAVTFRSVDKDSDWHEIRRRIRSAKITSPEQAYDIAKAFLDETRGPPVPWPNLAVAWRDQQEFFNSGEASASVDYHEMLALTTCLAIREIGRRQAVLEFSLYAGGALVCLIMLIIDWLYRGWPTYN